MNHVMNKKGDNIENIDLTGIPIEILEMLKKIEKNKISQILIQIAKSPFFKFHPEKFNLILTQSVPLSQQIMFEVLNSNLMLNSHCIKGLIEYTDNPFMQQKIVKYSLIPDIIYDELFLILMLGITDQYVEDNLIICFKNKLINNTHDFINYKRKYESLSQINQMTKKIVKRII